MIISIFTFFLWLFQCHPISEFWGRVVNPQSHGSCLNSQTVVNSLYATASMACAADVTFGILPIFMVWKLNLSIRTRFYLGFILGLGSS